MRANLALLLAVLALLALAFPLAARADDEESYSVEESTDDAVDEEDVFEEEREDRDLAASPTPRLTSSLFDATYTISNVRYGCAQNISRFGKFETCADGSTIKFSRTLTLKGTQVKNARSVCGQACISKNVGGKLDGFECVGYRQLDSKKCQLAECPFGSGGANVPVFSKPKTKKVKFPQLASHMREECFRPLPTLSPTVWQRGTEAPVAFCASDVSYERFSTHFSDFVEIKPDRSLCEMVQPRSGTAFRPIEIRGYKCPVESCVRRCYYDSNCKYVIYSAKLEYCALGTKMELTDDKDNFANWFTGEYRAFRRNDGLGDPTTPYYGGWCAQFTPDNCNNYAECRWNKGKRGYNVFQQGGTAGGFCGRIKCNLSG